MILSITIKGVRPLLMHNGRLANPLDAISKLLKNATKKWSKGDEDQAECQRLEFIGGLYFDEKLGPYIPTDNLQALLIEGARKRKLGKQFEALVSVVPPATCREADGYKLDYKGPRTIEELFSSPDQEFVFVKQARVNQAKVMRTRPRFPEWSITFGVEVDEEAGGPSEAEVTQALTDAGRLVGLGDWAPRYGKFEVISVNKI